MTDEALRLAQARYDNGRGSIVEMNQAQRRIPVLSADAAERLDVTARLAQARYDNVPGGMVEQNQATAEVAEASAKYEYLSRRAELDFAMGTLQ